MDKKRPGQPTKYRPEYCQMVIEHCEQGLSFVTFSAVIKVHPDTLHEWVNTHPEFSVAKMEALSRLQLFYERMGIAIMAGKVPGANAAVWIFNMKNRFKWRDQHEVSHTGADGGPIKFAQMPEAELKDRVLQLVAKAKA